MSTRNKYFKQLSRRQMQAVLAIALLLLLTATVWLLSILAHSFGTVKNTCPPYHENQPELNNCHREKVRDIARAKGIPAALQYVRGVVVEETNYITTHHVMHVVGEEAYYQTKDIGKSLRYLPSDAFASPQLMYFDGYQHGILRAFFSEAKKRGENGLSPALVKNACPAGAIVQDIFLSQEDRGDNCFHGIGHALMYVMKNEVPAALKLCEALPEIAQRQWCRIGVLMENSYLYGPWYDPDAPRPFVKDDAMLSLCASLETEEIQRICANYIGRAYWAAHYGDVAGAFAQCRMAAYPYRTGCIYRLARFSLPAFFKKDYLKMAAACKDIGMEYEKSCILAAADGIARGATGYGRQKVSFCDAVEKKFQEECRAVLK